MKKVLILGSHGAGDFLLSLSCAFYAARKHGIGNIDILACVRDEVYKPLQYLFGDLFTTLRQHPEKEKWGKDNWIEYNKQELLNNDLTKGYEEYYFVLPDLEFRNSLAFNWRDYNTSPNLLKNTRLITHRWKPEKVIYIGLNSSTPGYTPANIPDLIYSLGGLLPDYKIYVPVLDEWAGIKLDLGNFNRFFPDNVVIDRNPDFIDSLKWLEKSRYAVCTDNFILHASFHLGMDRLILDPRFGYNRNTIPFHSRWRQNGLEDSIPINTNYEHVARLIATNILIPQTTTVNKAYVLQNLNSSWDRELIFKF